MTETLENLILEHLRAIRGTQSEHGDWLNRIELRLSTIEQTLGSLMEKPVISAGMPKSKPSTVTCRDENRLD